jgi:hypothetical protein
LIENRGTCSSKQRLLAEGAQEFQHFEVTLMVRIYDMSADNTPWANGHDLSIDDACVGHSRSMASLLLQLQRRQQTVSIP